MKRAQKACADGLLAAPRASVMSEVLAVAMQRSGRLWLLVSRGDMWSPPSKMAQCSLRVARSEESGSEYLMLSRYVRGSKRGAGQSIKVFGREPVARALSAVAALREPHATTMQCSA